MKVTLRNLVDVEIPAHKIKAQDIDTRYSYKVNRLLQKAEPHLKFFEEERKKILEECGTFVNGKFVPADGREDEAYGRLGELLAVEVDEEFDMIQIPEEEGLRLSGIDMEKMESIIQITFKEEEKA